MKNKPLPQVTEATCTAVFDVLLDAGNHTPIKIWLEQMKRDNPVLAKHIFKWSELQPNPESALMGPALVYALLNAQVTSENSHLRASLSR